MKKCLTVVCILLSVYCLMSFGASRGSETNLYVEDFTTTQYKDLVNTTACWDTIAGELRLFPFAPSLAGSYDTPGSAYSVAISGDYAYVADMSAGLQVIDISDPTAPAYAGSYDTPGYAWGVAISGDYAYVADYGSGLQVIDISDPTAPSLAGSYDTPGLAWGVAISGDYAYVTDGVYGLQVIDISDPTAPSLAGSYDTPGSARGVAISGNYAYVADGDSGLRVIDISDPTTPAYAGSYDTPGGAYDVAISGDYAYVADYGSGLRVIDITDPTVPSYAGSYYTPGTAYGVAISGDYAYVADYGSGLTFIDITDPTAPAYAGSYDTPGSARGVAISGDYAYVTDMYSGLKVIRISDPAAPAFAGCYDTPGQADAVAISGDYAYVADGSSGLQVIDISDPTAPSYAGSYDTPGTAVDVAISGDYAYVADYGSGLQVIEITDPTAPSYAGSYDTPGFAYGVTIAGDYAYVADGSSGLQVIDISDPAAPALAGSYDTPGQADAVAISGDYAYVADWSAGLQVIDISDPTAPSYAGSYDTPGYAWGVAISGDYAYVADASSGLRVIDISDPTAPAYAGSYDTPGSAFGVAIAGDYAYVADWSAGLQVIDISDPTAPSLAGSYDTPGSANSVAISGDYAYVADYASGLQVLQVFQREFDGANNVGRSLAVDASNDTILHARLMTTQTNTVTWELSGDGGASWQGISPNGSWNRLAAPGVDLLWRSTHMWASPGINPAASQLDIDWLVGAAPIDSIVDVPDDQGRSVNLSFTRSGYDFLDETEYPVVGYAIYRRLDDPLLVEQVKNQPTVPEKELLDHPQLASFDPDVVRRLDDRTFILSSEESTVGTLPPGVWEGVGWVLPTQTDSYMARVNTLVDSTASEPCWTVFVTAVHTSTPSIWYVSAPDSGYSVDNIAPAVPEGFAVAYNTGSGNQLSWDPSPEPDFEYYRIYRGDSEDFTPGPGNLVHETATEAWADPEYDGWDVHYKITALDYVGNESEAASPTTITGEETSPVPKIFALHQNVPNPFNPTTMIRFDLPRPSHVKLTVYNVKGELVATLADEHMTEGRKEVGWEAKDNEGRPVASGVYFYRLTVGDFKQTRKMVLLR